MTSNKRQLFISWFLLTLFFITHYFIRVSPSLLATNFMKDFSLLPGKIGQISSGYFLIYTFSQIPIGYLLKRYPAKFLISISAICCGICAIGISSAPSFSMLLLCYLVFSFFGAFSFIGAVTFASQQLPQYQSILFGITQSLGMASGFAATNIVSSALETTHWRHLIYDMAWCLLATGVLIALFASTGNSISTEKAPQVSQEGSSLDIFKNPQTWLNALYIGATYFPVMMIVEGGIGPAILGSIHAQNTPTGIAFGISLTFIGWMVAGPIAGIFADKFGRVLLMRFAACCSAVIASILLYIPLTPNMLYLTLFLFGATNTGLLGSYSIAAEMHGKENAALSLSIASMFSTLIGAILCGILPSILELTCDAYFVDGFPFYTAASYQQVFSCMIYLPALSFICSLFVKETGKSFTSLSPA